MTKFCKIYFILQLYSLLIVFNTLKLSAQIPDKKYSFSFSNVPIEAVIDTLRRSVNYGFSFNPDGFPTQHKITIVFDKKSIKTILDSILSPIHYTHQLVGNNIVIVPMESLFPDTSRLSMERTDTMKVIQLSGKVMDRQLHKPVAYTSIYIKNRNIGTLSNDDGNFILKLPQESINDTVYFSCIGYKPQKLKIGDFHPKENTVLMDVNSVLLKEIEVKPINPKEVIKKAISNISRNYSRNPLMLTAFYRETIQQNNDYVGLSEAVLHIYKAPYDSYLNDQVNIYKGRKGTFPKQMDTVVFKFQGGIYTSLMLDIAKNPSNFISDEYLEYYDFAVDDIITIDGRTTYVISFDQNEISPYSLYKGKLFIDMDTYAFVRADFMISPKGLDKAADVLVKKSSHRLKVKPTFSSYIVNYSYHNETWYLNYIREEVEFKVKKKYSLYSTRFHSKAEMVITQTDTTGVQHIRLNRQVHYSDIFTEKIGTYDPDFWGGFNIIKPDESLENALQQIKGKLSR